MKVALWFSFHFLCNLSIPAAAAAAAGAVALAANSGLHYKHRRAACWTGGEKTVSRKGLQNQNMLGSVKFFPWL